MACAGRGRRITSRPLQTHLHRTPPTVRWSALHGSFISFSFPLTPSFLPRPNLRRVTHCNLRALRPSHRARVPEEHVGISFFLRERVRFVSTRWPCLPGQSTAGPADRLRARSGLATGRRHGCFFRLKRIQNHTRATQCVRRIWSRPSRHCSRRKSSPQPPTASRYAHRHRPPPIRPRPRNARPPPPRLRYELEAAAWKANLVAVMRAQQLIPLPQDADQVLFRPHLKAALEAFTQRFQGRHQYSRGRNLITGYDMRAIITGPKGALLGPARAGLWRAEGAKGTGRPVSTPGGIAQWRVDGRDALGGGAGGLGLTHTQTQRRHVVTAPPPNRQ